MGAGVAQDLAQTGHQVVLLDLSDQLLGRAAESIRQDVRLQSLFGSGRPAESPAAVLERISFTTDYRPLEAVDLVIENVTEKLAVKKAVYEQLDSVCDPGCIFAADTSAIPITLLAGFTRRPDRVIGMHFMNPAPLKPAVEVIRTAQTSERTVEAALRLLAQMGKQGILVNDAPGFVSNRVLMLAVNEAIRLVEEGVAEPLVVDQVFKQCIGHKMGPLETADLIGLDTVLLTLDVLFENFNDHKFEPSPLLVRMVADGLLGQKSGQGFYSYAGRR
jgi:3-hydroxybutyryl-CoA dehydrogenase